MKLGTLFKKKVYRIFFYFIKLKDLDDKNLGDRKRGERIMRPVEYKKCTVFSSNVQALFVGKTIIFILLSSIELFLKIPNSY